MPSIFPFTAIVGQDRMKMALILNAISPKLAVYSFVVNAARLNQRHASHGGAAAGY